MNPRHGWLYVADLNPHQGSEAGKHRPVVVLQTDLLNRAGHPSTWIVPCTTRTTGESVLRTPLAAGLAGNHQACEVMIDQSRAIDNARLRGELGPLPAELLADIKRKIRLLGEL